MKQIMMYAHTIENAEKDLSRIGCLLSRLGGRADNAAGLIYEPRESASAEHRETLSETEDLLYEFGNILGVVATNIEHLQEHLCKVRREAEGSAASMKVRKEVVNG